MFFYDFFFILFFFNTLSTRSLFKLNHLLVHSFSLSRTSFTSHIVFIYLFVCLRSNELVQFYLLCYAKLLEEGLYFCTEVKWVTIYFHFIRAFDNHSTLREFKKSTHTHSALFFLSHCHITFCSLCFLFCPRFGSYV